MKNNINFDDENLMIYYMQLVYKYEHALSEIKLVLEKNDLEYGTTNYEYVMRLLNDCEKDMVSNYE